MLRLLTPAIVGAAILAVGCSPEATNADENASSNSAPSAGPSSTVAEMATCVGCGTEVSADLLSSHDGTMLCKACIDAHGH
jgi:hypothetical protein